MFPVVSIDAGGLGGASGGRSTTSYVEKSFILCNSFRILALSLINITVTMTSITVNALIPNKMTVKTDAVTATPFPVEPSTLEVMTYSIIIMLISNYLPPLHLGMMKAIGSDTDPFPKTLVARTLTDTVSDLKQPER